MKLIHKNINRFREGEVVLVPEIPDDIFNIYNLLAPTDLLTTYSYRKVSKNNKEGSDCIKFKIKIKLKLKIETIEFDNENATIRVKGKNMTENEHVKIGQYHTHDLCVDKKFTIYKAEWDSYYQNCYEEACDASISGDLAVIILQEGVANLYIINRNLTTHKSKIQHNIPRKKKGYSIQRDKAILKFYENIAQAIIAHFNFEVLKCILVASPGFFKDDLLKYLFNVTNEDKYLIIQKNKPKFITAHTTSGFRHSLNEIFEDAKIVNQISETKAYLEVKALSDFYSMLNIDSSKAFYSISHVEKAHRNGAIDTLLITDELLKSTNDHDRRRYVRLVDGVRKNNGTVRIFSSQHQTGKELREISGVAAILRYSMPELDNTPVEEITTMFKNISTD